MTLDQIPSIYAPASKGITLYTLGTPNGVKASIALSILKIPYKAVKINIYKRVARESWYLENINPDGKIPALLDIDEKTGEVTNVWESGAILEYIVDKYDTENKLSYNKDKEYKNFLAQQQWLFYQNAGVGPIEIQAIYFNYFAPEKNIFCINHYTNETKKMYRVVSKQLEKNNTGFIAGDRLSIADVTFFGWIAFSYAIGIDLKKEFPVLQEWCERIFKVPGCVEGLNATGTWRGFSEGPWKLPQSRL